MSRNPHHVPIMVKEVLQAFEGASLKVFFEGTVGAGGHAAALLEAHPEIERYIGCDKDPQALALATERLAPWKEKIELIHADFAQLDQLLLNKDLKQADGFFLTSECRLCN